jgi:histone H3/H4
MAGPSAVEVGGAAASGEAVGDSAVGQQSEQRRAAARAQKAARLQRIVAGRAYPHPGSASSAVPDASGHSSVPSPSLGSNPPQNGAAPDVHSAPLVSPAEGAPLPRDAKVMAAILTGAGVPDFEPAALAALMEFQYRYVAETLTDATAYAAHAGRRNVNQNDVILAAQARANHGFTQPSPREQLMPLAQQKNSQTWRRLDLDYSKQRKSADGGGGLPDDGVRLPPDEFCLSQRNFTVLPRADAVVQPGGVFGEGANQWAAPSTEGLPADPSAPAPGAGGVPLVLGAGGGATLHAAHVSDNSTVFPLSVIHGGQIGSDPGLGHAVAGATMERSGSALPSLGHAQVP